MIELTNAEETFSLAFMLLYRDFWVEVVMGHAYGVIEKITGLCIATILACLFLIDIPLLYTAVCLKDILDENEINVYALSKVEILKLCASKWFIPRMPPNHHHLSWEYFKTEKLLTIFRTLFVYGVLILTSPIMFNIIYIFFVSTQKFFAKKEIIKALRA